MGPLTLDLRKQLLLFMSLILSSMGIFFPQFSCTVLGISMENEHVPLHRTSFNRHICPLACPSNPGMVATITVSIISLSVPRNTLIMIYSTFPSLTS